MRIYIVNEFSALYNFARNLIVLLASEIRYVNVTYIFIKRYLYIFYFLYY